MAKFEYTAMDAQGNESKGVVEASSQTEVLNAIKEQGLFPVDVSPAGSKKNKKQKVKKSHQKSTPSRAGAAKKPGGAMDMEIKLPAFMQRVKPKQLMTFTRQLATLINAGMPLVRSLAVLQRQEKNPLLQSTVLQISDSVESGGTFAEACAQHPRLFNRLFVNMVKAGEIGGILDQVLLRLAEFMEKAERIKSKVKSAMIYPIVVMIMAIGILIFLMVFIIPKFESIFDELLEGAQLPPLTQFVIGVSAFVGNNILYVIAGVVVFVVLFSFFGKTDQGRYAIDLLKLKAPVFGNLMKMTSISRFARTLGTLMASGVPVLQALTIVKDTAGNEVISRAVAGVHDAVKEGENMAPPIEASKQFPPMVVSMVEVGEETGELPEMLMKIADGYEDEVDDAVAGLTSVIEPILIVFLAVVVGTIVIALFLPLIDIIGKLS